MEATPPAPRRTAFRGVGLLDWLIVTVAAAATLALARDEPNMASMGSFTYGVGRDFAPYHVRMAWRLSYIPVPWTVAVSLMALNRSRSPLHLQFRRPGVAACGAASIWLGCKVVAMVLAARRPEQLEMMFVGGGPAVQRWAASAVAGAWISLALSGCWRPDRGPLDRLGRGIGATWLALDAYNGFGVFY